MEDDNSLNPLENWHKVNTLLDMPLDKMNGLDLVSHVKSLQALEQNITKEFEKILATFDPTNVIQNNLDIIDKYNNILTQIDLAHRNAVEAYSKLSQTNKDIFMSSYLPSTLDPKLYDNFIARAVAVFGSSEEQKKSTLAYQSDVLKIIATPEGYNNIKNLYDCLIAKQGKKCSKIDITLRKGTISQSYFAVRSGAVEKDFVTPQALLITKTLPEYIKEMKEKAPLITKSDLEKPTQINEGVSLQLFYPFPENLNKPIIKIGQDKQTDMPCFIYSPRFISLHHEFNHMVRMLNSITLEWIKSPDSFKYAYKNMEEFVVIQVENALREKLGLAPRLTHSGITYDKENSEALKKFCEGAIDMYFRALLEIGIIPESKIKFDPDNLKLLTTNQKLELIQEFAMIKNKNDSIELKQLDNQLWVSEPTNQKFEKIKEESLLESHPLFPLVQAELLDPLLIKYDVLSPQEIKNLSDPKMQDSLLFGELSVDFVRKLSDSQVEKINNATGLVGRYEVIRDVAREVHRPKLQEESSSKTTTDQSSVSSQVFSEGENKNKFGRS